jgi:8-oxo-dGTP pyrophosphatase MutT (NUDIX family)
VFLLLFEPDNPHLLAIQKSDSEGYPWRNQVALPGGHADEDDDSPLHTAFRELEEELGISRDQVEVIGTTGHFQTINHVDIQVFAGLWNGKGPIRFDTNEIARVLKIPLKELFHTHVISHFHGCDPDMANLIYPFGDVEIWGATARILHHFIELMYPLFESQFNDAG